MLGKRDSSIPEGETQRSKSGAAKSVFSKSMPFLQERLQGLSARGKATSQMHPLHVFILSSLPPVSIFCLQHTKQSVTTHHETHSTASTSHLRLWIAVKLLEFLLLSPHHINIKSFCYCLFRMSTTCLVLFFSLHKVGAQ